MPISFGKPKEDDVVSLIAAKDYARAVELLKGQLRKKGASASLRMQLADLLILANKKAEAVALLLPLADEYAGEGFAAKAVSVLKKVQKIDPRRRDVDAQLAQLIQEKQREAVVLPISRPTPTEAGPAVDQGPELEIGLDAMAPVSAAASPIAFQTDPDQTLPVDSAPLAPLAPPVALAPERPLALRVPEAAELLPELPALSATTKVLALEGVPLKGEQPIEDYDLLYLGGDESQAEDEPLQAEVVEEAEAAEQAPAASSMSAGQFADEVMALVDNVFQESPAAGRGAAAPAGPARPSGSQIVVSPLFRDFSVDEMVAVIAGLKLSSFERGEVILREGEPGASLFILTSGRVRAFGKDARTGRQVPLADISEGTFFGELSILTGQPRTASVVALSRCELLELDRPTLDEITKTHPRVWDVLRELATQRSARPLR